MTNVARTTAGRVLSRIIAKVGIERVAETLDVSPRQLEPFVEGTRTMTLRQQHALAVAALMLSDDDPELRRAAATLVAQVGAAEDFQAGITERHAHAPPATIWH